MKSQKKTRKTTSRTLQNEISADILPKKVPIETSLSKTRSQIRNESQVLSQVEKSLNEEGYIDGYKESPKKTHSPLKISIYGTEHNPEDIMEEILPRRSPQQSPHHSPHHTPTHSSEQSVDNSAHNSLQTSPRSSPLKYTSSGKKPQKLLFPVSHSKEEQITESLREKPPTFLKPTLKKKSIEKFILNDEMITTAPRETSPKRVAWEDEREKRLKEEIGDTNGNGEGEGDAPRDPEREIDDLASHPESEAKLETIELDDGLTDSELLALQNALEPAQDSNQYKEVLYEEDNEPRDPEREMRKQMSQSASKIIQVEDEEDEGGEEDVEEEASKVTHLAQLERERRENKENKEKESKINEAKLLASQIADEAQKKQKELEAKIQHLEAEKVLREQKEAQKKKEKRKAQEDKERAERERERAEKERERELLRQEDQRIADEKEKARLQELEEEAKFEAEKIRLEAEKVKSEMREKERNFQAQEEILNQRLELAKQAEERVRKLHEAEEQAKLARDLEDKRLQEEKKLEEAKKAEQDAVQRIMAKEAELNNKIEYYENLIKDKEDKPIVYKQMIDAETGQPIATSRSQFAPLPFATKWKRPEYHLMNRRQKDSYYSDFKVKYADLNSQLRADAQLPPVVYGEDLHIIHDRYERGLCQLLSHEEASFYEFFAIIFFKLLEVGLTWLGVPCLGFAQFMLQRKHKLRNILIQMGDQKFLAFSTQWSPVVQIAWTVGTSLVIVIVASIIGNKLNSQAKAGVEYIGNYLLDMGSGTVKMNDKGLPEKENNPMFQSFAWLENIVGNTNTDGLLDIAKSYLKGAVKPAADKGGNSDIPFFDMEEAKKARKERENQVTF